MFKKISVVVALLIVAGFSLSLLLKSDNLINTQKESEIELSETLPETLFVFDKDSLKIECFERDKQFCAVEQAVKCTINPDLEQCHYLNLPKFIFMQDPSLERPTEISYKVINKRVLINNNVEIYTDSSCNGGWFGLCQGTVIYVLAKQEDKNDWYVKDIYAIE